MAVVKIIQSKKGKLSSLINYVEKKEKTEERLITGIGCSSDNAYNAMLQTKLDYGKTDGRQYVHLIQSFMPGEVDPVQAHEIGLELAKEFNGFQVLVATHKDKRHIHNHLIVNTVSYVDGRKIHSTKEDLRKLKERSNELCRERGLSTMEKPFGRDFYTMSERKLAEKGESIWKEQLRGAIDEAKANSKNLVEMKDYLKENFNIDMKIQNKNLSYKHPEKEKFIRGKSLGGYYTKEGVDYFFTHGHDFYDYKGSEIKAEKDIKVKDIEGTKGPSLTYDLATGLDYFAKSISRDLEKERIRLDSSKKYKDIQKEKAKTKEREKDKTRER